MYVQVIPSLSLGCHACCCVSARGSLDRVAVVAAELGAVAHKVASKGLHCAAGRDNNSVRVPSCVEM